MGPPNLGDLEEREDDDHDQRGSDYRKAGER